MNYGMIDLMVVN